MKRKLIAIILCVSMLIPCAMLNTFAEEEPTVDSGKVLYNQEFGESFIGKTLADAGLTEYTEFAPSANGNRHFVEVTSEGLLQVRTTQNRYFGCLSLPTDTAPEHGTYTLEMTFRFRPNASNQSRDNSWFGFAWGEFQTQQYTYQAVKHISAEAEGDWNFSVADDESFSKVKEQWKYTGNTYADVYGNNVTMKLSLEGNKLVGASLECNEKKWSSQTPIKELELTGDIGMYIRDCSIDIFSIKVVEGVDYTEYKGQFATKSYSDFYNTDVVSVGVQPGLTGTKARLVAEIDGSKFIAAGFKVVLSYTDNTDSANPVAVTTDAKDMTAHYAYTSLAADGVIGAITPEKNGNYLIAIVIDNIPASVSDLKVTCTPYSVTADGETYIGEQFVYDFATQIVVAQ